MCSLLKIKFGTDKDISGTKVVNIRAFETKSEYVMRRTQ